MAQGRHRCGAAAQRSGRRRSAVARLPRRAAAGTLPCCSGGPPAPPGSAPAAPARWPRPAHAMGHHTSEQSGRAPVHVEGASSGEEQQPTAAAHRRGGRHVRVGVHRGAALLRAAQQHQQLAVCRHAVPLDELHRPLAFWGAVDGHQCEHGVLQGRGTAAGQQQTREGQSKGRLLPAPGMRATATASWVGTLLVAFFNIATGQMQTGETG